MPRSRTSARGDAYDGGAPALEVARTLADPQAYRRRIADAAHAAFDANHVVVVTCPPGRPDLHRFAMSRDQGVEFAHRFNQTGFLPLLADGYQPYETAREHGPVFSVLPEPDRIVRLARRRMMDAMMRPLGARSAVCAFFDDGAGSPLGWIVVGHEDSASAVIQRYGTRLEALGRAVGETLAAACAWADALRAPSASHALSDRLRSLTPRERQIALLVAEGLSDLNVAATLGIAEATVGTHLHRVYRKLGVHSRVELALTVREAVS